MLQKVSLEFALYIASLLFYNIQKLCQNYPSHIIDMLVGRFIHLFMKPPMHAGYIHVYKKHIRPARPSAHCQNCHNDPVHHCPFSVFVEILLPWQIPERNHWRGRKIYLGSQFQGVQSKVSWIHCFGPGVRWTIIATGACSRDCSSHDSQEYGRNLMCTILISSVWSKPLGSFVLHCPHCELYN